MSTLVTPDKVFAISVVETPKYAELQAVDTRKDTRLFRVKLTDLILSETKIENVQVLKKFIEEFKFGDYTVGYVDHGEVIDIFFQPHRVFQKTVMQLLTKQLRFRMFSSQEQSTQE